MNYYFKMQILGYETASQLKKKTNELKRFCKFFDLHPAISPRYNDTYYVLLPDDPHDHCEVVSALAAYCYFHEIFSRIASDMITVPLDEFLEKLSKAGEL